MPGDTEARLRAYVELLLRWNRSINLIARGDAPTVWTRHVRDSAQLGTVAGPLPDRAIDLGSGGGFPGLVLAIQFGIEVDLIEEDQRKAAFLREAARLTEARATVHAVAIQHARVAPAPMVIARGLAPVAKLLDYAEPLLAPGGECLFPKSRQVDTELEAAARHWTMTVRRWPSTTDPNGVIVRLSDIARR
jgi:16S rRNA (guanine(527)-N(7))-methyltransferase RsmG